MLRSVALRGRWKKHLGAGGDVVAMLGAMLAAEENIAFNPFHANPRKAQ
jgi:hypothetical protein